MFLAGIKKELKLFTRGFRLWGILLAVVGIALMYPGMYKLIEIMADMLKMMSAEAGVSADEAVSSITEMMDTLAALYGGSLSNVGFFTGIVSFTAEGFLIMALLLMATAGGEQKKRSVIMPNCAGLTPAGYVVPKFAMYPAIIGILGFVGVILTALFSQLMFGDAIPFENVAFSGGCVAFYLVFMISVYFLFGIATGKPGIGVVVMYFGSALLPTLLNAFDINKYNPFALQGMIMTPAADADMQNFWLSAVVTVTLTVICCLLSLVITSVRRIDNSEGEANL
ncbi:MAG: ABC transporter permease [Ruminiclostridium sp.]|nr:ABC transporter permease [Ruminiclostridium sp.]